MSNVQHSLVAADNQARGETWRVLGCAPDNRFGSPDASRHVLIRVLLPQGPAFNLRQVEDKSAAASARGEHIESLAQHCVIWELAAGAFLRPAEDFPSCLVDSVTSGRKVSRDVQDVVLAY